MVLEKESNRRREKTQTLLGKLGTYFLVHEPSVVEFQGVVKTNRMGGFHVSPVLNTLLVKQEMKKKEYSASRIHRKT